MDWWREVISGVNCGSWRAKAGRSRCGGRGEEGRAEVMRVWAAASSVGVGEGSITGSVSFSFLFDFFVFFGGFGGVRLVGLRVLVCGERGMAGLGRRAYGGGSPRVGG